MGRGLLSRLDEAAASGGRRPDTVESIGAHLRVLLNTRKGDAVTVQGFGVPDFCELVHQFPHAIQVLQQSIRATILEFEPRLKNVSVRMTPQSDPLSLRFEITAQLVEPGARGLVRFQTQMARGGRFEVD